MRRKAISPASPAQRLKVREAGRCLICGMPNVVPMHVIDRSLGGCDDPLCVVAGCGQCHRSYDEGDLDLLPFLEPAFRAEQAHAVMHLGMARALRRITNTRLREERAA